MQVDYKAINLLIAIAIKALQFIKILGLRVLIALGHRNGRVQVLEESKVCAKWFHKKIY